MNYAAVVLRVLVKYCYTDELDLDLIFTDPNENDNGDKEEEESYPGLTDTQAVLLVQLRDAAQYFELPALHGIITNDLGGSIAQKNDVGCVFAVLGELWKCGESEGPLWDILVTILENRPQDCLFPSSKKRNKGIVACSSSVLSQIVSSSSRDLAAFAAVQSIQAWRPAHSEILEDASANENAQHNKVEEELKRLASGIDLAQATPKQLSSIKPTPLFPMERLYEAFVKQQQQWSSTAVGSGASTLKLPFAIVAGAGVECMNGIYLGVYEGTTFKRFQNCFSRAGMYGKERCTYKLIQVSGSLAPWKLVASLNGEFVFSFQPQELVLYESKDVPSGNDAPFAAWNRCEGQDPTPYVAISKEELTVPWHHYNQA